MICAIPGTSTSNLELVQTVFRMIANQNQAVPSRLRDMVFDVIGEARELSNNPNRSLALRHPESVLLALKMRSVRDLATSLNEVTDVDALRPELAGRVLGLMESHPA